MVEQNKFVNYYFKMEYPIKFKAAILAENNQPLIIDRVEFEGPLKVGQVLVKVEYSGICGKQIEEITGKMGKDTFLPHLLGHEGFGEVIECGPGVTTVLRGNKVVMHWKKGAGIEAETPDYLWKGKKLNAGWITTFNEYAVVSENRLTIMPRENDGNLACLLGCAVTTGIGVVINEANTRPYHSIAVCGCGGIGLNCIFGAKAINAKRVFAFDIKEEARKLALECGADYAYPPNEYKYSFDKVFVTATNSEAIEYAFEICKDDGEIFIVGVPAPDRIVNLNALNLHRNRSIHGSSGGGIVPERDIPAYYELHTKKIIDISKIISSTINLEHINDSINKMLNGNILGRHIIKF